MVQLQTPKGKILAAAVELKSNEYEELETLIYKQCKVQKILSSR